MSVSLEAENGILAGAYPNAAATIPHVGLVLCDPEGCVKQILVAKLSPDDARALAQSLADAAEHIEVKWDEWQADANAGGFDG